MYRGTSPVLVLAKPLYTTWLWLRPVQQECTGHHFNIPAVELTSSHSICIAEVYVTYMQYTCRQKTVISHSAMNSCVVYKPHLHDLIGCAADYCSNNAASWYKVHYLYQVMERIPIRYMPWVRMHERLWPKPWLLSILMCYNPTKYDLPLGLWMPEHCGYVTHHSYHTLWFAPHRQTPSSKGWSARSCTGCWMGK